MNSDPKQATTPGGIIHTYMGYDPVNFPSPTADPPDMVSPAFEHMLYYGNTRRLTEEELARAVKIDPSQIPGLGPNLEAIREMLKQRKAKILATYETNAAQQSARSQFRDAADQVTPPEKLRNRFRKAVDEEQLRDLENLYFSAGNDRSGFARSIVQLSEFLGQKYQVDQLAAKYDFTGREAMSVPKALEVKQELETIDKLLEQIEEAMKNAQIGLIDMEALSEFADQGDMENLHAMQRQINEFIKQMAEQQGIETNGRKGFQLAPKAYRLFQKKLLTLIFSDLQASRSGRHQDGVMGEGAVETQRTKEYEFGDSVTHMDIPSSMVNALLRGGPGTPVRMKPEDIVIHRTRNNPKAATAVLLDMSGSMRYDAQYANVKRMGLALDGLIRSEYPGDFLQFIEMYTFAKPRHISEIPGLLPKPVTLYDPVVRLAVDMSNPKITEMDLPPHFTNIQHGLQLSRKFLATQDTPNKQIVIITDGLPTAHFEKEVLHLLYPPHPRTEQATMREAQQCAREGITINLFLISTWNQSEEDVKFAYRMAETTKGRVVFTAGNDLDRFVVWDYIKRRKQILS
ncbi:vWA domain-containing protein [Tuwongella immobilis]|uniref:VWFA domain-containing protein n=1 Tax=Tuwongella immobilis TaxID=692036 RepID=A0A6C2YR56_9BACT|nr:hypothetical protein [Tuwongella immobilis]VIP04130.1 Uncharacterized protein OS=Planctomyces maris DSM 8797 GN=PM8797T_16353 PE=4 SV=1: VWA_2 [Tuwongella immobilis]VTS05625.1 Uncharacterized protein OS=Planctomyces maris DSM 8797 GN=PM8797T_16353 PE=4 SV=1: VWA_2 [Tuwongella immobilis]